MDTATKTKTTNRASATQHTAAAAAVAQVVAPSVQRAPRISSPHDPAEKEADATAKQVMRMSVPDSSVALVPSRSGAGVYRQVGGGSLQSPHVARFAHLGLFRAAAPEEKEAIQRAAGPEEKEAIQRTAAAGEKEPIQRAAAPEEKEPIQRAAAPEEKEPIQRAAASEEKEPIQRAAAPEEKDPIQRAAAPDDKESIQRAAAPEDKEPIQRAAIDEKQQPPVQRKADGQPDASSNVAAEINSSLSSGEPLPASVRRFMEPRFGANFSGVRMHTDSRAAKLNKDVSARAFAYGNHIFFGNNQFQPHTGEGRELIAHELTHTIQQRGAVQRQLAPNLLPRGPPALTIAQPSSSNMDSAVARQTVRPSVLGSGRSIQRRETPTISQRGPPSIQRLGVSDALNYFADAANAIPGYRMFTIVLGVNPINMSRVERSAANILRAVVEFIPGGNLIVRALDAYGIFDRVGTWVEQQLRALGITGSSIRNAINRFLNGLSWRDIFRLGSVWNRAKSIFTDPISRILSLLRSLGATILGFIRDAILRPLAGLASRTPGWDLLCAVLGSNPITGEAVPRTADTIIGGFMKMIGQEEVWNNIKKANAIARAWAWFQGALGGLMGFVRQIPGLFMTALRSLEIADVVLLPRAFIKVGRVFAGFAGRFISWALGTVMDLLQIIFEVVAPGVMPVLRRAAGAFQTIIRNPIGFVRNLVRAGIQGFRQFAGKFLTHLRASIIGWLTGAMSGAGVYIPQAFTLQEILKFVLSVLGLTWQNIRVKLVRAIGEPGVRALEVGFDLVKTLVTQGPAAAWQQILESLTNLREMVMEQVMSFVATRIVQAAITRLVTSLNPAGAFIQAILAIYNTVMFFIERLRQIAQVATAFINSIAAIASGNIAAAANRVEQTMAGMLTLVISFLARLVGLGRVSDAVTGIINRVRAPIDRALDRVVAWIVAQARRLGALAARGARAVVSGVLRTLRGPSPVTLSGLAPTVQQDVDGARQGAVLYQRQRPSGPAGVQDLVRTTPGARFDDASGTLTIPPINAGSLAASTLRGIAERLGRATGASRVTLAKRPNGWALDVHINPTLAGLASFNSGNPSLNALLAEIRAEETRVHPQREVLMAICREAARRHRATVTFGYDGRNRRTTVVFALQGAPAVTHTTHIETVGNAVCPGCDQNQGVTGPHNVIPASMWGAAIDTGFTRNGVTAPYDGWAMVIRSRGTSTSGPAVTEDLQCRACEINQDRVPAGARSPSSLPQRRAGSAAGFVLTSRPGTPTTGTVPEMFVGRQFGVAGRPGALTEAQVREFVRLKIEQVLAGIEQELNRPLTSAVGAAPAGARPATSLVYTGIVAAGRIPSFLDTVARSVRARAYAARGPTAFV